VDKFELLTVSLIN